MQKISLKNKLNQKLISGILLVAILTPLVLLPLLSTPKKASAQLGPCVTVTGPCASEPTSWLVKFFTGATATSTNITAGISIKTWAMELLKEVLRAFARRLLAQMTQSIVTWINSGFHGAPLFLERPGSFFKDIAKFEIKNLINTIGYDSNRFPYGKSFALGVIQSYKSTFEANSQYSLSKVINDPALLNNYRNDFAVGGWNGFFINTQYPQNNYLGYQMMTNNHLADLVRGTDLTATDKVKDVLSQGAGFLSPQTCPSNPAYNNLRNEFQKPVFKCSVKEIADTCESLPYVTESDKATYRACVQSEIARKDAQCADENKEWAKTNDCPGGLVNTTPGSVVGAQIMKAITGPYDQTSLAAAMGNSLSAIFDALLNKFLSKGLSALTSSKSTPPPPDDFDFFGQTLGGSPTTGTGTGGGFDWGGPDQVVTLSELKQNVQSLITNGNNELKFIDNNDPNDPGALQVLSQIFPKTQELDVCVPGPNIGWQERLDLEAQRAGGALSGTETRNEFISAIDSFKEWLNNKINTELPGSTSYLSVVNSIKDTSTENSELTARESKIIEVLTKLQSMKTQLDAITAQPTQGSPEEATMVRLKQRIDEMIADLSTTSTVNEMHNKLDDAKSKLTRLNTFITTCSGDRSGKGWSLPGGAMSTKSGTTEQAFFCDLPVAGGYSHGSFLNTGSVTYPEIPLVNGAGVSLSCEAVFRTSITDYKKSTPVP